MQLVLAVSKDHHIIHIAEIVPDTAFFLDSSIKISQVQVTAVLGNVVANRYADG